MGQGKDQVLMSKRPPNAGARFPLRASLAGAGGAMVGASLLLAGIAVRIAPDSGPALIARIDGEAFWGFVGFVLTMGALGFLTGPALSGDRRTPPS